MVRTVGSNLPVRYNQAMSRPRFENLDPSKQRLLMDAAAAEFGTRGFEGASLNRILEVAGISKSSLYYYFDDKADLFGTLLEKSLLKMQDEIGPFDPLDLDRSSFWPECERFYGKCVDMLGRDEWFVRLGRMFYQFQNSQSLAESAEEMFSIARQWAKVLLEHGQALGQVRTDLPIDLLVTCTLGLAQALDEWVFLNWEKIEGKDRKEMTSSHIGMFRRLLYPEN